VTSLGPVVVIAAGVVLLHERLNRSQWAGIALVGVGVALLALA
jgi:drug/metabolite transporter (DMT)-like permease